MDSVAGDGASASTPSRIPALKDASAKFSIYQNPALSAALSAGSVHPSKTAFLVLFFLSSTSAYSYMCMTSRWEAGMIDAFERHSMSPEAAILLAKIPKTLMVLVFAGSIVGFFKAMFSRRSKIFTGVAPRSISKSEGMDSSCLSKHQLGLLGLQPKAEAFSSELPKKPPKSKLLVSASDILVPIHLSSASPGRKLQIDSAKSSSNVGHMMTSLATPLKAHGSPLLSTTPTYNSPLFSIQPPRSMDSSVSPWSSKQGSASREISTEEQLERFLAEVDEKLVESAGKHTTPSPTIRGLDIPNPTTAVSPVRNSGTSRNIPLRPVRMSPGSQKFTTPPKKKDGDLPSPMSIEESIEAFKNLGIYPQIEKWRDRLRQWFSAVLLKPLLTKIDNSHIQVVQTAAKLGISVTVSKVGTHESTKNPVSGSGSSEGKEWQPGFLLDEDAILHQIRATLLQASTSQTSPQQNSSVPMQECVDAIAEHQRLRALMKGEWAKGLLPQTTLPEEYMVQRVHELAEGTCLKNYKHQGIIEKKKNWSIELPTDSHILLYLFFAYLEHPKWMLHVDPFMYAGTQSSKNPLFLGVQSPKEQSPNKYISVVSSVPQSLHQGACILVCGKQNPPIFCLYWDKKLQFSLQGRSALWDSILLLCHKIKTGYGAVIRGVHLGSSAFNLLPIIESENELE